MGTSQSISLIVLYVFILYVFKIVLTVAVQIKNSNYLLSLLELYYTRLGEAFIKDLLTMILII